MPNLDGFYPQPNKYQDHHLVCLAQHVKAITNQDFLCFWNQFSILSYFPRYYIAATFH